MKIGQQVICIRQERWMYRETRIEAYGPENNQVCTITEISEDELGTYIRLRGFETHGNYNTLSFRPLEYGKSAISDLNRDFKERKETMDIPVKKLKTIKL